MAFQYFGVGPVADVTEALIKASRSDRRVVKWTLLIGIGFVLTAGAIAFALAPEAQFPNKFSVWFFALGLTTVLVGLSVSKAYAQLEAEREIETKEVAWRAEPEKPSLAWDLARTKLESYLDRNLTQVQSIFWLTLFAVGGGFGLISWGLYRAFDDPQKLPVAIVASASGVLVSFIGGSFLLVQRSVVSQARGYVTVLERINAVGMAVQVISNIPQESAELRNQATAELARQLLQMYSSSNSKD